LGRRIGEWSDVHGSRATEKKEYIAKCTNYFSNLGVAELLVESGELSVGDKLVAIGPTTGVVEFVLTEIRFNLQSVSSCAKGDLCSIALPTLIRRSDKIYKIVPTAFYE